MLFLQSSQLAGASWKQPACPIALYASFYGLKCDQGMSKLVLQVAFHLMQALWLELNSPQAKQST